MMKLILLIGIIFVFLVSIGYSTKLLGFEELRFDGAMILNSTTLSIKTNNIVRMFVDSAGNVGINNTNPVETLEVSGNVSVHNISVRTTKGNGSLIFHNGTGICIGSC